MAKSPQKDDLSRAEAALMSDCYATIFGSKFSICGSDGDDDMG